MIGSRKLIGLLVNVSAVDCSVMVGEERIWCPMSKGTNVDGASLLIGIITHAKFREK